MCFPIGVSHKTYILLSRLHLLAAETQKHEWGEKVSVTEEEFGVNADILYYI